MRIATTILVIGAALAGCAATPPVTALPAVPVFAKGETAPVGTANADAADDPAIWRNADNPAASLIVGTDKKAGLYVYGMDGKIRHFLPAGRVNNVDLVTLPGHGVIVAASDRSDPAHAQIALFRLDTQNARLEALGKVDSGAGEAYGLCLSAPQAGDADQLFEAFSVLKDGTIRQIAIREGWTGAVTRTMRVPSQAEGCVVDPDGQMLYVGEENAGIWGFQLAGPQAGQGELLARIGAGQLVADVEGLALGRAHDGSGMLVASSQGDNAYAAYSLPQMQPLGRFRIVSGAFGSTEETDGIDLVIGDFGPDYPQGLFVAQDGQNAPRAQNFKLVSWADILAALAEQPAH